MFMGPCGGHCMLVVFRGLNWVLHYLIADTFIQNMMYRPFYGCRWKWFSSSGLQGKSAKSWKWMESCITWLDNLNANEFDKIISFCPTPKFSAVTCKLGYYYKLKVYPKSDTDAMSIWCVVVKYGCLFQLTKHTIIVKWWMACNIAWEKNNTSMWQRLITNICQMG